jgi:predicted RNase H-like nuclease (RuvC/YqgF family)
MIRIGIVLSVIGIFLCVVACGESKQENVTSEDVKKETEEAYQTAVEYTAQQKEEIQAEMRRKLDDYKQKIEQLRSETETLSAEAKAEVKRRLEELRTKQQAAEQKLSQLKSSSGKAWNDIKQGLDRAVDDLEQAYKNARSQFS